MTEAPPATSAPDDEGIACLACGYNLTGTASNRCPECGSEFDREALMAIFAGKTVPIPSWGDRPDYGVVHAFAATMGHACLHPVRTARVFPCNPAGDSGWRFSMMCYAIAATTGACGIALTGRRGVEFDLLITLPWLVGVCTCESVLALFLSLVCAHGKHYPKRYAYHRGLVHLTSIHTIPFAMSIAFNIIVKHAATNRVGDPSSPILLLLLSELLPWLAILVWTIHVSVFVAALDKRIGKSMLAALLAAAAAVIALVPAGALLMLLISAVL